VEELRVGRDRRAIAGAFHRTLAEAVAQACVMIREREKLNKVTLSGGVFQNALLLELTLDALAREGFQVYFQTQAPPNDGGLCLGQAAVALAQCR
jgi:hydrogenase maturation protein HypF